MKYDALTLDTNIFTNNGYALEHGLLKQLEQFKKGSIKFILSEIIVREISRHITRDNVEIRTKLDKAVNRAKSKKLLAKDKADEITKLLSNEDTPEKLAQDRMNAFQKNTGFEVIKANSADIDDLIKLYFNYQAPFENNEKKKNEFPDAIALLSLEKHAKENNLKILAVSNDKGWINFADKSQHIDVTNDFTSALADLQSHAEEAAVSVEGFLTPLIQGQSPDAMKLINNIVEHSLVDLSLYADGESYCRFEASFVEMHLHDFELVSPKSFSLVQIGRNLVVAEVPITIHAHASAEFDFYVPDSEGDLYLGSNSVDDKEIEFQAAMLLTLEKNSVSSPESFELTDVEVIKIIDTVDFGFIHPYEEPEYEE